MTDLVDRLVPEELWTAFRQVVPPAETRRPQGGGRRRAEDRATLAAIVFVATSGCTWRQLPPVFGPSWPTVYRHFARWSTDGVWARLHTALSGPRTPRHGPDGPDGTGWSRHAADSIRLRAAHRKNGRPHTK
ncbi:IS5 family transposase [Streptomyces clavuligerus]|nr:transposase [Streptomyces clavuligerus]AXU13811.1 IS5 family transposase [Streptomyces clavuligerus]MBY6303778.1 IS5 family transposase [Streptomyces clavuligerus]QCS06586.1 IS5 family transposase [Streptomyces clavuligerus]QPJ94060.1 IS5 family transposase [Streptomyces clavuligerus]